MLSSSTWFAKMELWVHTISQSKVYLTRMALEYFAFFSSESNCIRSVLLCKKIFWKTKQRQEGVWHEKMSPIQAFPWLQIGMVISKMLTFISPINSCISSRRESWKKMTKICMNPFEFSILCDVGKKLARHFSLEWNPIYSLQCAAPPVKTRLLCFAPSTAIESMGGGQRITGRNRL